MEKREFLFDGKAKQLYASDDPDLVIILYKDDASAYNGVKRKSIHNKGVFNNRITEIIYKKLEKEGIKTHFIKRLDDRNQLCKKVNVIPIEFVVRNVVAGTLARRLDLDEGTVLGNTIYEICYKNDELRDPFINDTHALALGLVNAEELKVLYKITARINDLLIKMFDKVGITVVDFKVEYGHDKDGNILLADEISPDTARFWDKKTNYKLDKDRFRRDLGNIEEAYKEVLDRLEKNNINIMKKLHYLQGNINEECGVFGVFNCENAADLTYYGLHALQHRGQEGCGIATTCGMEMYRERGEGLVTEIFSEKKLSNLKGNCAIGHVRYSTAGGGGIDNVQPFLFRHHTGDFALCHNGNIVNSRGLKDMLESQGSIFQSTSDTEILAHLIKMDLRKDRLAVLMEALTMIEGAYAFLLMTKTKLYICRDKNGLRPLSLGKLNGGYVISSETCAMEAIGASFIRDIQPAELVVLEQGEEMKSYIFSGDISHKMCSMEFVYFSRPDSDIEGINVHTFRKNCGKMLAKKYPVDADIVIGVPDSSTSAAIGYAEESGIPYEMGLIKNKYVGRTFIQPSQELREKGVRLKLSPVRSLVNGKKVILIDDSIVRGTTSKRIVKMLREAGATEIHVRIGCPPMRHPCFYGMDTSTYAELVSATQSVDEVCKIIGADSLCFLSQDDLLHAGNRTDLCFACYDGNYPTHLYQTKKELNIERKF